MRDRLSEGCAGRAQPKLLLRRLPSVGMTTLRLIPEPAVCMRSSGVHGTARVWSNTARRWCASIVGRTTHDCSMSTARPMVLVPCA